MKERINEDFLRLLREPPQANRSRSVGGAVGRWTAGRRETFRIRRKQRLFQSVIDAFGAKGIVVSLPEFQGEFELNVRSHITRDILTAGAWEPRVVNLLKAALMNGDDAIDVGANAGLYSVLMARLIGKGRLLAVEPAPSVLPFLQSNLRRNGLSNVEIFHGVATSQPGTHTLFSAEGNEEYSSLAQLSHPNAPLDRKREFSVPGETLDHLVAQYKLSPRVLKIDVEGAEGHVFRGAANLLRNYRPIVFSELDDRLLAQFNETAADVGRSLSAAGYQLWDAYNGSPLTAEDLARGFVGEVAAIPQ